MRSGRIQTSTGTIEVAKALVSLQPITGLQNRTLHRETPASPRTMTPIGSITPPTPHQTVTILDLRGIAKRDDMQLNCCRPTTLDTGYNPETASTWGFRPKVSKHGRTVKLRSA